MQYAQQIMGEVRKAVMGKDRVLLWVLATILARGHILLEDIPGVGKTTLALHIATAAEAAGLSAAIIDLDPQASAAGWGDSRQGEAPVVVALPHTRLPQGLQAATDGGAELVVIDTAPHSEAAAMAAAATAAVSSEAAEAHAPAAFQFPCSRSVPRSGARTSLPACTASRSPRPRCCR